MPTDLNIGDLVQSLTNPLHFGIIRGMLTSPLTSPNIVYLVSWFYGEENLYPPRLLTKVGNGTK